MELAVLKDVVIIFALSTFVNFVFTKIKVPTIIGYLLTGIIVGPHLFSIIADPHRIDLMAEIGVVLLMFSIGLEFSLNHLVRIRHTVFIGGFLQLSITAGAIMLIGHFADLSWKAALFIGFLVALSSTAVVLKVLQTRSDVTSNYGRTVVGILIFQDVILIPLILLTPLLGGEVVNIERQFLLLGLKTIFILAFVYIGSKWLVPKLLRLITFTKNQELFFMSILLICLAVALLTSNMGMSLAFGAFLAGLMISESEYSQNAFGNLIPFKDTFTSFFFVSIGMMLNLNFVIHHFLLVAGIVLLVVAIKIIVSSAVAFSLGHTLRGLIMVGFALGQVGEFSFILAKIGMSYSVISPFYYQLFIAVTVITMLMSPFMIQLGNPVANLLLKFPMPKYIKEGIFPLQQIDVPHMSNHLVLIGKDSRALNLSLMVKYMNLPYVSIIFDPALVRKKQMKGESVIYGDANNEPILHKANINSAEVVVISIGDLITALSIVHKVRLLNKHAFIIVRTKLVDDVEELYRVGADQVIPEEFETAIEIFDRVLSKYLLPRTEINEAIAKIREDHYGIFRETVKDKQSAVLKEIPNIEIVAYAVKDDSVLIGKSLAEVKFRKAYGVTLVAIKRKTTIIEQPGPSTTFENDDIAYLLGRPDQVANAIELFSKNYLEGHYNES